MSKFENFNLSKAEKFLANYKKNRHYAKEMLLTELISWQYFFGNSSIVGVKISTVQCYSRKTIETVLNDLGYMLTSYKTTTLKPYRRGISKKFVEFTFAPKNSTKTAEG